jgi:AcrR family transcriptional regulator
MRADARRNYERLIATAREVFFKQGVDAPLDDIVKRAGLGAGTLYRHFPAREILIEAVYRSEIEEIAEQAYALAKELSAEDAIREWFRELIRFQIDRADLASALKAAIDEDSNTYRYCRQKLRAAAWALLEPAQAVGAVRPDLEAVDLMRLSHGIGAAAKFADDASRDRMLSVLMEGLRP